MRPTVTPGTIQLPGGNLMAFLTLLSLWLYGGLVSSLGNPEYAVRALAHRKLESLGWLAVPALEVGLKSRVPEVAERCCDLLDRLPCWEDRLVYGCATGAMAFDDRADAGFLLRVCRVVDGLGGWKTTSAWDWSVRTPYMCGSLAGDVGYAVRWAAARRGLSLFFPLVPAP